jgi:ubiquinone/menaquinone biosynthesis C-methylase UbiE
MIDQTLLTQVSQVALERGVRLLQGYRLADTDYDHMMVLLGMLGPQLGARILDVGSGFGEAAHLLRVMRPDLKFMLLNNNRFQLAHTPEDLSSWYGDMHDVPFSNGSFDVAMFLYSLCHADDLGQVLREAARVTRPGGMLFVYDYVRDAGDDLLAERMLCSHFFTASVLRIALDDAGWNAPVFYRLTTGNDAVFRRMVGDDVENYQRIMRDLTPVVIKAWRE